MSVKEAIQQLVTNTKVASGVAVSTTGSGLGTYLDWIPGDIGKLATLIGIVLSIVLIYSHLRRSHNESVLMKIKISRLARMEKEDRKKD